MMVLMKRKCQHHFLLQLFVEQCYYENNIQHERLDSNMYQVGDVLGPDKRFKLVRRDDDGHHGFFVDIRNEIPGEFRARITAINAGKVTKFKQIRRTFLGKCDWETCR